MVVIVSHMNTKKAGKITGEFCLIRLSTFDLSASCFLRSPFWGAAEGPEADAAGAGLFAVNDQVEALFQVEWDVALVLGLDIARDLLGIGAIEPRTHQRP